MRLYEYEAKGLYGEFGIPVPVARVANDLDELGRREELARRGVAELGLLAENQRRLLSETRAVTDRPGELLESAQQTALELARLLEQTEAAARTAEGASAALGESELAAELARRQRELATRAERAAESLSGSAEESLAARRSATATQAGLLELLQELRERLAEPLEGLGEGPGAELALSAEQARERAR